jgi:hypothetical protein
MVGSRTTKRVAVTGVASDPYSTLSVRFREQLSEVKASTEARLSAFSQMP